MALPKLKPNKTWSADAEREIALQIQSNRISAARSLVLDSTLRAAAQAAVATVRVASALMPDAKRQVDADADLRAQLALAFDAPGGNSDMLDQLTLEFLLVVDQHLARAVTPAVTAFRTYVAAAVAARNELVTMFARYASAVAVQYEPIIPREDIVAASYSGLLAAAGRFDPARGRFSTYCDYWCRMHIQRALNDQSRTIYLPRDVASRPDAADLRWRCSTVGYDAPLASTSSNGDGRSTLLDVLTDDEHDGEKLAIRGIETRQLRQWLARLTPAEQRVVQLMYGIDAAEVASVSDIAEMLGSSRGVVNRQLKQALAKLQAQARVPAAIA